MAGVLLTPDMTGYTTPRGEVSASSTFGVTYPAYNAMDINSGSYWVSGAAVPSWIKYDFGFKVTVQTVSIYFYTTSYHAIDYTFECSHINDFAGEQTILYTKVGNTLEMVSFDIAVPVKARYFRLYITKKQYSSYLIVREWSMYGLFDSAATLAGSLTINTPAVVTYSSTDTSGALDIDILRTEKIENIGSGNAGRASGAYTRDVAGSNVRMSTGEIDTLFKIPTSHDWLMFEVYDVEGVSGDIGDTWWTDRIPDDIVAYLVASQDEVNSDPNITNYSCKAIRYHNDTGQVDSYVGNQSSVIAPEGNGIPLIVPSDNWLITKDIMAPSAPVLDITTIEGLNSHQIEIISPVAQEVQLLDTSTGTVVDSATATSVILTVPETGDIRTYQVYCKGDTTQVKFLGIAKHSSCNFARASSITTLDNLYADGSDVTSFSWNGECNVTSAIGAWTRCSIENFPSFAMPNCTDFSNTWQEFSGTFDDIPDTSSGTVFYRTFYLFSGPSIPAIDLRISSSVVEIALSSTSTIDTFNVAGKTNFTSMMQGFAGTLVSLDTSSGTNFERMFQSYSGAPIPALDLRSATSVLYMFNVCLSIYTSLNTTGVTNFSSMFYNYDVADTLPAIDTSSGINFSGMFQYANGGSVSHIDIRNGTSFANFVYECTRKFLSINTAGRTSLYNVFYRYYYTGDFPLIDTAFCTNWDYAFQYSKCSFANNSLDMSAATTVYQCFLYTTGSLGHLDIRSVATTGYTFYGATGQILSLNTSGVTNFDNIFRYYRYTGNLPFFDTSSGTSFYYMFYDCSARLVSSLSTGAGINFSYMFYSWDGQTGSIMPDMDMRNGTNLNNMFSAITLPLGELNTIGVTNFTGIFKGYHGASTPTIITTSGTNYYEFMADSSAAFVVPYINVGASLERMFANYTGPTPLSMDISNAGSVADMFSGCSKEIVSLSVTGKTSLNGLFRSCDYTGSAPDLDSALCTDFGQMFNSANFSTIPPLATSNGTVFEHMFNYYKNSSASIGLDFSKSIDADSAFVNCNATITHLHLTGATGNANNIFYGYLGESIPSLDLNTLDQVYSAFAFTYAPFAGAVDVSQRTNCTFIFHDYYGPSFPHLDLTSLIKIISSTNSIFKGATADFTTINLTGVVALDYMFYQYNGTSLPAMNTDSATTFNYFIAYCGSLVCMTNVNTINSTSTIGMFDVTTDLIAPNEADKTEILAGSAWVNTGSCP